MIRLSKILEEEGLSKEAGYSGLGEAIYDACYDPIMRATSGSRLSPSARRVAFRYSKAEPVPGSIRAWHAETAKRNKARADLLVQLTAARSLETQGNGRWPSVQAALKCIETYGTQQIPEREFEMWEDRLRRASEYARSFNWNKNEIMRVGGWR